MIPNAANYKLQLLPHASKSF